MINDNAAKKPLSKSAGSPAARKKAATVQPADAKPVRTAKSVAAPKKAVPVKPKSKPDSRLAAKESTPPVSPLNGKTNKSVAPAAKSQAKPQAKIKPVAEHKEKTKKPKLIRDSFTMPEVEYQVLADVKKMCIKAGFEIKKSELLRIGMALIQKMDAATLKDALASLQPLKAGRPKKEK